MSDIKKEFTHEDFKEMKKALKLTNANIAEITGLSKGNVDNTTKASTEELPAWIKSMLYVYNRLK